MKKESNVSFNETVLNALSEKGSKVFFWHNSKRKVYYKLILTEDGIEIRRANSNREYPDKDGYKWFVSGSLNLETVEKAVETAGDDFRNKRNGNRANSRIEKFKKQYYSIILAYGEEYAYYLLEEPELFLESVKVRDWRSDNEKYWKDVKYKEDVDEWIYWSIDSDSIYEYVAEQMICDDESKRKENQYSSDEYEELAERAGNKEKNYFCGGIARHIKSCTGYEDGYYGSFGLVFNRSFYKEFKEYDVFDGDPDKMTDGDYKRSFITIGDTPDSIADYVSIREGDLSFMEDIEERQYKEEWDWDKVYADAVKKINKEVGKDSVYFAYADFEECVAEYVVGNYRFAKWFKKKYPGTDLKKWLMENLVNEDGEYYDHSYGRRFDFEEWWKESFESEEE